MCLGLELCLDIIHKKMCKCRVISDVWWSQGGSIPLCLWMTSCCRAQQQAGRKVEVTLLAGSAVERLQLLGFVCQRSGVKHTTATCEKSKRTAVKWRWSCKPAPTCFPKLKLQVELSTALNINQACFTSCTLCVLTLWCIVVETRRHVAVSESRLPVLASQHLLSVLSPDSRSRSVLRLSSLPVNYSSIHLIISKHVAWKLKTKSPTSSVS